MKEEEKGALAQRSIKCWPIDERPREKLFLNGEHTLTDSELVAILLSSGTKGASAIDLARSIMGNFRSFRNMSHTDERDWKEFKGLGKAKTARIRAALEIARRFQGEIHEKRPVIKAPEDVVALFKGRMRDLKYEVVKIIFLNGKNRIIETVESCQGTPTSAYPVVRDIFSKALQNFASSFVLIHNHPSGDPLPSREDEAFTAKVREAGKAMDIKVVDHLIFGEDRYYSFENGYPLSY